MRTKTALITTASAALAGIIVGAVYFQTAHSPGLQSSESQAPLTGDSLQKEGLTTDQTPPRNDSTVVTGTDPDLSVDQEGLSRVTAVMSTPRGEIRFKFYSQDAPNTVKRVVELIQQGFYDGLSFHRVIPNFVIQTGDPHGTGAGGSGKTLRAEFNERRHVEGTVAMARASDPHSADSQFYITLSPQPHLDRSYTVIGLVVDGLEVIHQIQKGDQIQSLVLTHSK